MATIIIKTTPLDWDQINNGEPDIYDHEASEAKLTEMCNAKLAEMYPGHQIEWRESSYGTTAEAYDDDGPVAEIGEFDGLHDWVPAIIGDVYGNWKWVIEK